MTKTGVALGLLLAGCVAGRRSHAIESPTPGANGPRWETSERLLLRADDVAKELRDVKVSPDGKRLAYSLKSGQDTIDGKPIEEHWERPLGVLLHFSADSQHVAYKASKAGKSWIVLDGQRQKEYNQIDWFFGFGPDSRTLAYIATVAKQTVAVIGGRESKPYHVIGHAHPKLSFFGPIVFSKDGKHSAFAAAISEKLNEWIVVIDGKEQPVGPVAFSPVLSSDGSRWACLVEDHIEMHAVIDGRLEREFRLSDTYGKEDRNDGPLVFSPDAAHVAYPAYKSHEYIVAGKLGKQYMVVDGQQQRDHPLPLLRANQPVFSPDSRHLAFVAGEDGRDTYVVRDNARQWSIWDFTPLVFSPDSQRLASVAVDRRSATDVRHVVVVDGQRFSGFRQIYGLAFTRDSRSIIYVASDREWPVTGKGPWFVVIDGQARNKYDEILSQWQGSDLVTFYFTGPSSFAYLAIKDKSLYWVEEKREESAK